MTKGHATLFFSLEELRLIAHCITYALVRDGLKPGEWRDAKQVLDDITTAIHEGNLRREDEGSAPWSTKHGSTETTEPA
jgi:hypothetical protein